MTIRPNPHDNKTDNGVVITIGMRVRDYDYKDGMVVADRDNGSRCADGECGLDHWFDVKRDDGTTGMFNGTRLLAL